MQTEVNATDFILQLSYVPTFQKTDMCSYLYQWAPAEFFARGANILDHIHSVVT